MTLVKNKICLMIMSIIATLALVLTTSPANAEIAPNSDVTFHNQGDSDAHIDLRLLALSNNVYEVNVLPGQTVGEGSSLYPNSEPLEFYNRAGWCSKYWINNDLSHIYYVGSYYDPGSWVNVNPGSGRVGDYLVRVKTWNC